MDEDDNEALLAKIMENGLKGVLVYFQKDKSMGLDEWPIEFYLEFYDMIGGDIHKVVESRKVGHMHAPLNSTFIPLILKDDIPTSFDDFKPISL